MRGLLTQIHKIMNALQSNNKCSCSKEIVIFVGHEWKCEVWNRGANIKSNDKVRSLVLVVMVLGERARSPTIS